MCLRWAGTGAAAGAAISVILTALSRIEHWSVAQQFVGLGWKGLLVTPVALGVAAGAVASVSQFRTALQGAALLDQTLSLKDRFSTAMQLSLHSAGPAEQLAIADAEATAARISAREATPLRAGRGWLAAVLCTGASVVMWHWLPAVPLWNPRVTQPGRSSAVSAQVVRRAESALQEAAQAVAQLDGEEAQRQAQTLSELEKELSRSGTQRDSLASTARAVEEAGDLSRRTAMETQAKQQRLLESLAATSKTARDTASPSPDAMRRLSDALRRQDVPDAAQAVDELREQVDAMSPEERAVTEKQLEDLAAAMEQWDRQHVEERQPHQAAGQPREEEQSSDPEQHASSRHVPPSREEPRDAREKPPPFSPSRAEDRRKEGASPEGDETLPESTEQRDARGGTRESTDKPQQRSDRPEVSGKPSDPAAPPRGTPPQPSESRTTTQADIQQKKPDTSESTRNTESQPNSEQSSQTSRGERREEEGTPTTAAKPDSSEGRRSQSDASPQSAPRREDRKTPTERGVRPESNPSSNTTDRASQKPTEQKNPEDAKPVNEEGLESGTRDPSQPSEQGDPTAPQQPAPGSTPAPSGQRQKGQDEQHNEGSTPQGGSPSQGRSGKQDQRGTATSPEGTPPQSNTSPQHERAPSENPQSTGPGGPSDSPGSQRPSLPPKEVLEKLAQRLKDSESAQRQAQEMLKQARTLKDQAQRLLDEASPEQRRALDRLANELAQHSKDGKTNPTQPPQGGDGSLGPSLPVRSRPTPPTTSSATTNTVPVDARARAQSTPQRVIADILNTQAPQLDSSNMPNVMQQAIQHAAEGAESGIESQVVPADRTDLVRRVFRRYQERVARPTTPPAPVPK